MNIYRVTMNGKPALSSDVFILNTTEKTEATSQYYSYIENGDLVDAEARLLANIEADKQIRSLDKKTLRSPREIISNYKTNVTI